jgi:hypothetical protein
LHFRHEFVPLLPTFDAEVFVQQRQVPQLTDGVLGGVGLKRSTKSAHGRTTVDVPVPLYVPRHQRERIKTGTQG